MGCGRRGNLKLPDETSPDEQNDGKEKSDEDANGNG
jgi:predicted small lipoprotein YifL